MKMRVDSLVIIFFQKHFTEFPFVGTIKTDMSVEVKREEHYHIPLLFYPFFFPPAFQLIGPCSIHHPLQYSPSHISPLSPSPCHQSCSEMIMYLDVKIPNIQTMSDQMIDYLLCQFLHSIFVRGHGGATTGIFLEFTFNLVHSESILLKNICDVFSD